jgi:hypothetical protein
MKNALLISLVPLFLTGIILFSLIEKDQTANSSMDNITLCAPIAGGTIIPAANGKFISPLPGWGNYSYSIATTNDSAQFYFNQGLNMYYSYHMKESLASFKEASRLDPGSAMTYWGQALAMGPYYNAAHSYKMPVEIQRVLQIMNENSGVSETEKSLIKAMNHRYSEDPTDVNRKTLNETYAAAMRELIQVYPDDQDIKTLYVDAMMVIHAWDFWNNDGTPKAWTNELVQLCEAVLKKNPDHPAALHYHIHLTEASRHPEVALPNADKLKDLFPGVAHMVHMSSHEYERNGLFEKGVMVNDLADENLVRYDSLAKNLNLNKQSPHYFAVQTYCALSGGMYETGMRAAMRCRKSVSPTYEATYDQYLYMLPSLTLVRLGKWEEILKDEHKPDAKWTYAQLLHHFSKGMAYVQTGQIKPAKEHLALLRKNLKDPVLEKRRIPFNAPLPIAQIAEKILQGSILFSEKKYKNAIARLNEAIQIEDGLIYTEPNDWPIPARQFLGAYYLKMGKPVLAERIYQDDILRNPGNGWSYVGLYEIAKKQNNTKLLSAYESRYKIAFSKAEEIPARSVYLR